LSILLKAEPAYQSNEYKRVYRKEGKGKKKKCFHSPKIYFQLCYHLYHLI